MVRIELAASEEGCGAIAAATIFVSAQGKKSNTQ